MKLLKICFVDLRDFFYLSTKPLGKQILVVSEVIRASGGNLCTPAELGSFSCSSREGSLMFLQTVFVFPAELGFVGELSSFHSCAACAPVPVWWEEE